ncbi:hypothetical protein D3C85_90910 [compost metagenome]
MALSTLLLLLKSLFPFLKEILLRDKTLKAFVGDNKTATFLLSILVLVFILFLAVVDVLSDKNKELEKMKESGVFTTPHLEDANKRIKELEDQLKLCRPVQPDRAGQGNHHPSTNAPSEGKKGKSLKDYASSRLKSLDDNGK